MRVRAVFIIEVVGQCKRRQAITHLDQTVYNAEIDQLLVCIAYYDPLVFQYAFCPGSPNAIESCC